jgi:NitT/TauT family transport system substrate-binding protein
MKKIISLFALALLVGAPVFSQAAYENQNNQSVGVNEVKSVSVNLAVMAGPTGFGSAALSKNDGKISDTLSINAKVYSAPTEVIAQLVKGTEDIAALPSNLAAVLYNKDVKIISLPKEKYATIIFSGLVRESSYGVQIKRLNNFIKK